MKKNKIGCLLDKYREGIMYLIFGVATTVVNFALYTVLVKLLEADMTLSNGLSWVCAVIFAFVTNKIFVFQSKSMGAFLFIKEMTAFFGSRIITGIVEIILPTLLYKIGVDFDIFGIKGFSAKVTVSVIVIILNYVFSKFLVFKNKTKD